MTSLFCSSIPISKLPVVPHSPYPARINTDSRKATATQNGKPRDQPCPVNRYRNRVAIMTDDVRVGIDIGGTFTDVVVLTDGEITIEKTPTTPESPAVGALAGLEAGLETAGVSPAAVTGLSHGTTVTTNALLEGDLADTALVTTEGFRDVLEIGRQDRPELYALDQSKPDPIVPREHCFTVAERLDERGNILTELDEAEARATLNSIPDSDIDSVAIALLFAFENETHERQLTTWMAEIAPDISVSTSSEVLPEIREYERTLATAINAGLKPVMDQYLAALETAIDDRGIPASLWIMQSNGGLVGPDRVRERPITTVLSGPAAGVQGAAHVAARSGYEDVITMDMGGTSCDVSLVTDEDVVVNTEGTVGEYPIGVPMVDVHTVGAGGGSIAWIDDGGALSVGPRSAGADPGPVCYGRGGTRPTVTDAQLVLGRLDPDGMLSAELSADESAVREAIAEHIADPLGQDVQSAARGIIRVANANMERAIREVTVERGHDPRHFALVAFGGAGPIHAGALARKLDIETVLVPPTAGVLSAHGLGVTDLVSDYSTSMVRSLADCDPATVEETLASFEADGQEWLDAEGIDFDNRHFEPTLDLRYEGQAFDISVPVPDRPVEDAVLETTIDQFHEAHERRYGHARPDAGVELVTVRLRARGVRASSGDTAGSSRATAGSTGDTAEPSGDTAGQQCSPDENAGTQPPHTRSDGNKNDNPADAPRAKRRVWFDDGPMESPVYDRRGLGPATTLSGPAIIEGPESTVTVHPDQQARVDEYGTLVLEVGQ